MKQQAENAILRYSIHGDTPEAAVNALQDDIAQRKVDRDKINVAIISNDKPHLVFREEVPIDHGPDREIIVDAVRPGNRDNAAISLVACLNMMGFIFGNEVTNRIYMGQIPGGGLRLEREV